MKITYFGSAGTADPTRASIPLHLAANGSVESGSRPSSSSTSSSAASPPATTRSAWRASGYRLRASYLPSCATTR